MLNSISLVHMRKLVANFRTLSVECSSFRSLSHMRMGLTGITRHEFPFIISNTSPTPLFCREHSRSLPQLQESAGGESGEDDEALPC